MFSHANNKSTKKETLGSKNQGLVTDRSTVRRNEAQVPEMQFLQRGLRLRAEDLPRCSRHRELRVLQRHTRAFDHASSQSELRNGSAPVTSRAAALFWIV